MIELYFENNTDNDFDFDAIKIAKNVIEEALAIHKCEYDSYVSLYIVEEEEIQAINKDTRDIDKVTDVLSFPGIQFEIIGDYSILEDESSSFDYFDPDTGLLNLGEIVICYNKVISGANEYGHSELREYAFLVAHSILHLLGYDHMTDEERIPMEEMQNKILNKLNITRE